MSFFTEWGFSPGFQTAEPSETELLPVSSQRSETDWEVAVDSLWTTIKLAQEYKTKSGQEKKELVLKTLDGFVFNPQIKAALPHLLEAIVAAWKAESPQKKKVSRRRCIFF